MKSFLQEDLLKKVKGELVQRNNWMIMSLQFICASELLLYTSLLLRCMSSNMINCFCMLFFRKHNDLVFSNNFSDYFSVVHCVNWSLWYSYSWEYPWHWYNQPTTCPHYDLCSSFYVCTCILSAMMCCRSYGILWYLMVLKIFHNLFLRENVRCMKSEIELSTNLLLL